MALDAKRPQLEVAVLKVIQGHDLQGHVEETNKGVCLQKLHILTDFEWNGIGDQTTSHFKVKHPQKVSSNEPFGGVCVQEYKYPIIFIILNQSKSPDKL